MNLPDAAVFIGVIVVMWIVQIVLSWRQAIGMSRRIAEMRREGTVAVGLGRGRLRSRTYAVVSVGQDGRVIAADVLRGWSVMSRPTPIRELPGLPFERLCGAPVVDQFDTALRAALCQVVATLSEARASRQQTEGGAPIVQRA